MLQTCFCTLSSVPLRLILSQAIPSRCRCAGADEAGEAQAEQERDLPARRAGLEQELSGIQQRLEALQALQPLAARCHALRRQGVPELTQRTGRLQAEAAQQASASMAAQDEHREAQEALQVPSQSLCDFVVRRAMTRRTLLPALPDLASCHRAVAGQACCAVSCSDFASSPQAAKSSGHTAGGAYLSLILEL